MNMATAAELRQRVGEDLGIVPIGQLLESQDQSRIDASYLEAWTRLKNEGLAAWPYSGEIPDEFVPFVALMIEQRLLTSYSVPESRYVRITNEAGVDGGMAVAKISRMLSQNYYSVTPYTDY